MPELVNGVLVLVASPGDAREERAAVRERLNDWSVDNAARQGVVALPWLYERHAVPQLGDRPQSIINAQAVDRCDVLVAFFDSRIGTDTGVSVSGTAEEIQRAIDAGKPVHVYFSQEPLSRDADLDQLVALKEFKKVLEGQGLLGDYADPGDLAAQLERVVQKDIDDHGWGGAPLPSGKSGARLTWQHVKEKEPKGTDKRGRIQYKTTKNSLIVRNESQTDAENLDFELASLDDVPFHFDRPRDPVTLHGGSERQWTLIPLGSSTVEVVARWTENGKPCEQTSTFTISR